MVLALMVLVQLALMQARWPLQQPDLPQTVAPAESRIERFHWTRELPEATSVEVLNPYGNILARPAEDGVFEVSAMIQTFTPGPHDFTVLVDPGTSAILVRVEKKAGSRAVFVRDSAG